MVACDSTYFGNDGHGGRMRPLYVFKLDNITGEIKRFEVTHYHEKHLNRFGKVEYCFKVDGINKASSDLSFRNEKLNRFVNGKVVSFEDDVDKARKIIVETLRNKSEQAAIEKRTADYLLKIMGEL